MAVTRVCLALALAQALWRSRGGRGREGSRSFVEGWKGDTVESKARGEVRNLIHMYIYFWSPLSSSFFNFFFIFGGGTCVSISFSMA